MGCDIHMHVEHRIGDTWKYVDPSSIEIWGWRNYELFSALAGVRNRFGVVPIFEPRGVPDDVSQEVAKESEEWGVDGHSHTHLSLTELTLWEGWRQTYTARYLVAERSPDQVRPRRYTDEEFRRLTDAANHVGDLPWRFWPGLQACQGASPPDAWRELRFDARLNVAVGETWWRFMFDLHRLGLQSGADHVRLVYWFDN